MIYLILLSALALRLISLNQSFWLDEAASLVIARQPLAQLLTSLTNDFHPPLFYLLLHFWLKLGLTSEWFLRLPNLIFALLTLFCLYKLILIVLSPSQRTRPLNAALIATLFLALNPLHIYYSQELRMYTLNALLTTLSWFLLFKLIRPPRPSSQRLLLLGFIITTSLNLYSFYGAFMNLFAQLIFVFFTRRRHLNRLLFSAFSTLLLFLPGIPLLLTQISHSHILASLPGWSAISGSFSLKSILLLPAKFTIGRINISAQPVYFLAAAVTTSYLLSLILLSLKLKSSRLFLYWLLIPLFLALLLSLKLPLLGYWRYLYLLPPFVTLIALGLTSLPRPLLVTNFVVLILTFLLLNLFYYRTPAFHRENWRQAAEFVAVNSTADTITLFAFPDAFAPIRWYSPRLNYVGVLNNLSQPTDLDINLSQATLNKNHVFLFDYLTPLTDPRHEIASWITNAGYELTHTYNFVNVGFVYEYQAQN